MSRSIKLAIPVLMGCVCLVVCSSALAQGVRGDRGDSGRDESWYYSQPGGYESKPLAIIQQRAMDRAAHRQARLEAQNYSGEHRMRPTISPMPLFIASTYPYNYVYGPPLVANDWGNTQISVLGEGNRATMRGNMGRRSSPSEGGWPNISR
jgi:hypothetical protein